MRTIIEISPADWNGHMVAARGYNYLTEPGLYDGPVAPDAPFLAWLAPLEEHNYDEPSALVRRLRMARV